MYIEACVVIHCEISKCSVSRLSGGVYALAIHVLELPELLHHLESFKIKNAKFNWIHSKKFEDSSYIINSSGRSLQPVVVPDVFKQPLASHPLCINREYMKIKHKGRIDTTPFLP